MGIVTSTVIKISYARMTIVYDTYRVDRPLIGGEVSLPLLY